MQSEVGCSSEDRGLSLVSVVFSYSWGETEAGSRGGWFREAQDVEVKEGVQVFADSLQRPHRLPFGILTPQNRKKHSLFSPTLNPDCSRSHRLRAGEKAPERGRREVISMYID